MSKPEGYKEDEFIHFIRKESQDNKIKVIKEDGKKYELPSKDMYEIPFSDIESVNLNVRGTSVTFSRNNVVNLERYMLWYWSPIIGGNAIILYLHLWEYCNQDDGVNICYPKLSELAMKLGIKDTRTIVRLLNKLQENNFLIWAYRLNKMNNHKEDSPVYKLRETVPLLSKEQVEKLSPKLKKKHEKYMEKFSKPEHLERFTYDYSETLENLTEKSDMIVSSKTRKMIDQALEQQKDNEMLLKIIPENSIFVHTEQFHEELEKVGVAKPSREFYYMDVSVVYEKTTDIVYVLLPTQNMKEYFVNDLKPQNLELLEKSLNNMFDEYETLKFVTVKNYIVQKMKSK